jgi:hypothetical protein
MLDIADPFPDGDNAISNAVSYSFDVVLDRDSEVTVDGSRVFLIIIHSIWLG